MRRFASVLAPLSLLVAACATPSADHSSSAAANAPTVRLTPESDELRALSGRIGTLLPSPDAAAAVVLVRDGAPLYGFAGSPAVGPGTGFEFASVTKVMTAVLMAGLSREGVVDLDGPFTAYVGGETDVATVTTGAHEWSEVTLRDLLIHRGGVPFLPPNLVPFWLWLTGRANDPFAGFGDSELERAIAQTRPAPGAGWEYSNFGYALLGYAAASATGSEYATLLEQRVLIPTGMATAAVDRWLTTHVAPPLSRSGRPVSGFTFDAMAPAGAVRGSITDAAAFLGAAMTACDRDDDLATDICRTLEPQGGEGALGEMGLGWVITRKNDTTAVWHNGGTGGYSTFLGFSPENGVGVAILTNVGTLREVDAIAMDVLFSVDR